MTIIAVFHCQVKLHAAIMDHSYDHHEQYYYFLLELYISLWYKFIHLIDQVFFDHIWCVSIYSNN